MIVDSHSVNQTEAIAAQLAGRLRGGECIALHGELGAGKTQFVRGIVQGLGGQPQSVSSPTFVLLNIYDSGRLNVYHLDAYRVQGAEEFEAIGFPELLEQGGVVIVEWAQRIVELLPKRTIHITLTPTGDESRRIQISDPSSRSSGRMT